MAEIDIYQKNTDIEEAPKFSVIFGDEADRNDKIANHRTWLQSIRKEHPQTAKPYKVGIYIRYFNQTKYENYLDYHIKNFEDTLALCPQWTLVDYYIDEGSIAPNMENSPEWCRLLEDCFDEKVDLIITQKISNVSKKPHELTFISRLLASLEKPVGIYFISEDVFTLATYYLQDMKDTEFIPEDFEILPEPNVRGALHD